MACTITYNNKKYTQPEFNEYLKSHFFEFAGEFLESKQDIEEFKRYVSDKPQFIKASKSPNEVDFNLKAVEAITSKMTKVLLWYKQIGNNDTFWNKLQQDLGIPKQQVALLRESEGNTIEDKLTSFVANYSYTIEVNDGKQKHGEYDEEDLDNFDPDYRQQNTSTGNENSQYYSNLTVPGGTNYTENEIATPAITPSIKGHAQFSTDNGIGWFRSDEQVKGGNINKVKVQSEEPTIAFDNEGNPYQTDRIDIRTIGGEITKTRRILEVQSDLFQKGRYRGNLVVENSNKRVGQDFASESERENPTGVINPYEYDSQEDYEYALELKERSNLKLEKQNNFLQLLNKDNNWVTFFVKSIIQDSAKKGYEKVLFPSGDTASKVEGHTTLEEFKKQKENRISQLQMALETDLAEPQDQYKTNEDLKREITQLKQELARVDKEGFGALRPIYNFYENVVKNVLKKNYSIKQVTDEYGNTWNEITLEQKHRDPIMLMKAPKSPVQLESTDRIVFGHPGIGKTYLRESGRTDVIDFDSDYKSKINEKFSLPKGFKARNDFQKSNKKEYQEAVRDLWNKAKQEAKATGKQLFASDMILLREFANDFDKVITMSKDTFIDRAKQRNDYTPGLDGTEGWKNNLDAEIAKIDKSKVIITDKYLADLLSTKAQVQPIKSPAQFKKELIGRFGKKFGNNQTIIDSNRYTEALNAVGEFNKSYGSKAVSLSKDSAGNYRVEIVKSLADNADRILVKDMLALIIGSNFNVKQRFDPIERKLVNSIDGQDIKDDYSNAKNTLYNSLRQYNPEMYDALSLDGVEFEVMSREDYMAEVYKEDPNSKFDNSDAIALYYKGKITLFSDAAIRDEKHLSDVLLHELVHYKTNELFSVRELSPKEALFKKRMERLYAEYNSRYKKNKEAIERNTQYSTDTYGFESPEEFVAELMSNGNFYRILEQTQEGRNMFQKAWDYFLDFIGVKKNLVEIKKGILEHIKSKDVQEDNSGKILFLQGEESEYKKFLNDVLASYAGQIEKLESTSLNKIDTKENVDLRIIQLRSEMNALKNSTDQAVSIDHFVNNLYGEVISGVPFDPTVPYKGVFGWLNKHSFVDLVKEIKRKLKDEGIKDYEEATKTIMYIRTYLEDMQPLLEQLQNIVEDYDDLINDGGSGTIAKIRTLLAVMNKAKKDLSNMQEIYLEGLDTEVVDKESEALIKKIDRQIQMLDQRMTISTGDKLAKLQAEKKLLVEKRNVLSSGAKNRIHKELISASGDVSIFNMLFAPIWQSKDVVLKSVYKLVRQKLESIIPEFLKISMEASAAFEEYKKAKGLNNLDKSKFNEGLYEKVKVGKTYYNKETGQYVYTEGEEFLQLVDDFDILAYNKALAELVALANKSDKVVSVYKKGLAKLHKPKADWKNLLTKKYEQYLKIYRGSDRGQIEFYNWLKQNTYVPAGGFSTRAKDLDALVTLGQITELDAAKTYIAEIMASDESAISFASKELYEIDKSKFKNPKHKALDEPSLKYLNVMKSLYQRAQDMLDDRGKLGLRLPSVRKSLTQKLVEKDFKSIKDSFSPDFIDAIEDEMRDGSDIKSVPVYYAQGLDVNEVSTDLMQSIMLFYKQALRYKAMSEVEPQIKAIRQNMSIEALPGTVDSKGKPIMDRIKKMIGSSVQLESAQDWRTLWFDQWIDQVLYGKTNLPIHATIMGKDIRVDKLLDRLQGWAAFSQLGGIKFISHFANLSNALMQNLIESSAGQYYTTGEIGLAITKLKSLTEFLSKDVLKFRVDNPDVETSYSKIGQLFEIMQPFQAEYLQQLGTNISKSKTESVVDINNWFLPQNIGDSYPAMVSTIAMLINQKVVKDGKEISLYDALNLDQESGKLDFSSIQLLDEDSKYGDVKTLMDKKLRPKLININEQIYGVYSSIGNIDAPLIRKHAFGRLLEMYRKFIVPGIKRRWKEDDYNYQTESLEEGYYRTFWRMIKQDFIETIKSDDSAFIKGAKVFGSLLYKSQGDYTKEEIQNIRRARAEYLALISLTLIGSLFYSLGAEGDDDDDDYTDDALRGMGYLMMRLNSEIKFFHPLAPDSPIQFDSKEGAQFNVPLSTGFPDWMRILKSPTALTTHAQNLSKVVTQVLEDPSEEYQRSTSLADKGDNKLYINTLKLLGLNSGMSSKDAMSTLKAFRQ